jgi:uncharacterized protein (TIGR02246 family)
MRCAALLMMLLIASLCAEAQAQRRIIPGRRAPQAMQPPAATQPPTSRTTGTPTLAPPRNLATTASPTEDAAADPQEQAIRQSIAAQLKAFNAADAKALAALFTAEAEIVDEQGNLFQGRDAIRRVYANLFASHPKAKMDVSIKSIRFVAADTAIEEGTSAVALEPGETGVPSRYTVVHVKQDGGWLMASARDLKDDQETAAAELDQLSWMAGSWVDESSDSLVKTNYRWVDNHKFLLGEFTVQVHGRPAMTGTQRIGWDPLAQTIRSWVFDSEGGFSEGTWTRQKNAWVVKLSGVTGDGRPSSATNIFTRLGPDRYAFDSRDRVVGSEMSPDMVQVVVVREPPRPKK